ncbi:restriction endonuclease subunit S [Clostridium sp. AM27-31LB]|uniref:restriction endonuclease subunit S n=1 Tax=Clostridia TaxID=186801 RepID=UPI000E50753C|nr:restriction endonuclease subunit S [Clostridium sp. AM27-31LB]RHT92758.1 restriction endonuclease subunit S [Clostridium sp. AM27-31LB]
MAKKPNIRFAGFEDDWEQRKLGEVAEYRNGKAHENNISETGKYVVVNSKFVSTDGEVRKFSAEQIEPLYEGEIAFVLSDVPNGRAIARTFLVDESGKYTLNQRIAGITPNEHTDSYFLHILMNRNKYFLKFDDGNKQTNLSVNDVMQFEERYPSYREQTKIGAYFSTLDHLITLHQRKCDEVKKVKKIMLQKMFPKKGEKNPEIRFNGFTNDWEQRKLGEVCVRVTRKNKNNESDLPLTIASQYGLIDQRDFFNKVIAAKDMSNYYLLKKGEFAYNKSYSKGFDYGSIKRLNAYEQGCLSTLYICFSIETDEVDSDYLECFFDTLSWYHDVSAICAEGARNHGLLNVDVEAFFKDVNIEMPSQIQEQRKISVFINTLDHLITLHQRKCEELKNVKKYMLQNMFAKGE